jgi:hypothetical protein
MMQNHKLVLLSSTGKNSRIQILKSFCTGFFINLAKKHQSKPFFFPYISSVSKTNSNEMMSLFISPQSSLLFSDRLEWVIYNDVQFVNRPLMRIVSRIDFSWVKVLLGRIDIVNFEKIFKKVGWDFESEVVDKDQPIVGEFEATVEVLDTVHQTELDLNKVNQAQKKHEQPNDVDEKEAKRKAALERYLERKRLK